MCRFCLVVELHQVLSATNGATPTSLYTLMDNISGQSLDDDFDDIVDISYNGVYNICEEEETFSSGGNTPGNLAMRNECPLKGRNKCAPKRLNVTVLFFCLLTNFQI